ncbi:MAG TPA: MarR family transcriptional regulator, partial [Candidatus Dormibacteraeota bacterium]
DNPDHETSRLVRLTPRGRRTLSTIQTAQRAWANDIGAKIGEANLRHFGRMVDQLTQVLVDDSRLTRRPR